jgi:diacylglycerol kinase family enzyme
MSWVGAAKNLSGAKLGLGRRAAALVALGGLAGALLALGLAVVRNAWRVPIVLLAVAATVMGLWYLLVRRGLARLLGGLVAGVGLLVFLVVILTADHRGLPLLIGLGLIVVSASATRYALDANPLRAESQPETPVDRPAHPVLLMNPHSGGGKVQRFRLVEECQARGIEPVLLGPGDDLMELAVDAVARGADTLGMAGGDGSQALVASIAAERGIPFVCVPAGTRNHFALDLGIDRADVVGALDAFIDGQERLVDLARVNGRVFVNNACMGLYAKIVQSEAYRDAKLKTAADMLPDLLGPNAAPFDLQYLGPNGEKYPTAHLLLVSNNPYELDYLAGRGTRERMDLGTLGIASARIAGPRDAVTFVALEGAGKLRNFKGWLEWNTATFRVDSSAPIEVGIDGEALLLDPPLIFESLPRALRVRLAKNATGLAPAANAVHFTSSTVGELTLAVLGRSPVRRPEEVSGANTHRG